MKNATLTEFTREKLAQLGREYMLTAQFNSRTGYAALRINHGEEAYKNTAIDNWMAASPVYTRRMQRAMRLDTGSDIATILKGMQLECGLSHQYFDAGFQELSETEGRFWLNSCGPLLETEPRGEEAVRLMCHDIEDPTFDATAVATNPRARVRPNHRPPRVPADRQPHCDWNVSIIADAEPLQERDITRLMRGTRLAGLDIERGESAEPGGLEYYDGPLFEQLQLERFSHSALVVVCKELAIQVHLLINSLGMVIARRYGDDAALDVAEFQMAGSGWVSSERLKSWLGIEGAGLDAVFKVLQVHPAFQPGEYVGLHMQKLDGEMALLELTDCPAVREEMPYGWHALLQEGRDSGLQAMLQGIDPRVRIHRVDTQRLAWELELVESAEAAEDPLSVQIAKGTVLYRTKLENHLQLLEVVD